MHTPLTKITTQEFDIELDILYATKNNITNAPIYKQPHCYLHPHAITCLNKAITLANELNLKIKIYDAFRPLEAQQTLWDKFPDPEFVSNPQTGKTPHCRGIAVDLTIIDNNNNELDMGTKFDAFTPLSHHGNTNIPNHCQENRKLLLNIMTKSGWQHNPNEWWHYQLPNHTEYKKFTDTEANTQML